MDSPVHPAAGDPALYPPTLTPPAEPLPLIRFLFAFVANPLATIPATVYERDFQLHAPTRHASVAWVTAPELVEQILVSTADRFAKTEIEKRTFEGSVGASVLTSDGAAWRWQRRALAPLFRPTEITRYVPSMAAAAEGVIARWRQASGNGEGQGVVRAVEADMTDATFDVITRTMLEGSVPAEAEVLKRSGADYLENISWEVAFAVLKIPRWVPHPAKWQMMRATRRMRAALDAIIARRRGVAGEGRDLLGRLIAARDPETGQAMSLGQVADNLSTLLAAGHETTAKALTWALFLLARAPGWQRAVRDEVSDVVGDGPLEARHVERLAVTQRVIKEAMRLYPPAPAILRRPLETVSLDGLVLTPATDVVIPIFIIHRHRRLWDDPDRFDPDRFLPEREAALPRGQYMPFGAGPRICIGGTFALAEATVLLAAFVRAARFSCDPALAPEPISRVTLRPKGGMPLRVQMV